MLGIVSETTQVYMQPPTLHLRATILIIQSHSLRLHALPKTSDDFLATRRYVRVCDQRGGAGGGQVPGPGLLQGDAGDHFQVCGCEYGGGHIGAAGAELRLKERLELHEPEQLAARVQAGRGDNDLASRRWTAAELMHSWLGTFMRHAVYNQDRDNVPPTRICASWCWPRATAHSYAAYCNVCVLFMCLHAHQIYKRLYHSYT